MKTAPLRFRRCCLILIFGLALPLWQPAAATGQGARADYDRYNSLESRTRGKTFLERVSPHWQPDDAGFWYRNNLPDGKTQFVMVDAAKGERRVIDQPPAEEPDPRARLVPHPSRADASSPTTLHFVNRSGQDARLIWIDAAGQRHPYDTLKPDETHDQNTYEGHAWLVEDLDGRPLGVFDGGDGPTNAIIEPFRPQNLDGFRRRGGGGGGNGFGGGRRREQFDGQDSTHRWEAFTRENNLWLRASNGEEVQLSRDGTPDSPYQRVVHWSPDGSHLTALQTEPAQEHKVYLVESSPKDQLQPKLLSYDYLKPGDRIAHPHMRLFDVNARQPIPVSEDLYPNPYELGDFHWLPDSSTFLFSYNQRGHQVERIIAVDAVTGAARPIVEEKSDTFIDYSSKTYLHWLDATGELIWMSERDGWNHLYLIDSRTGAIKTQITKGPWIVRGVERIDDDARQIWLRVMGVNPKEDPYFFHLARVNFDGGGFAMLTEGDGTHQWEWSPNRRFLIDRWSRVDQPTVTQLRRASDGSLVCDLERADVSALLETGWRPPERFTAKGRDGKTDIYGIIFRPTNFDPAHHYPVIEQIYAGPQDFFVPKTWNRMSRPQELAELGFVVVQIDGMGTNWRNRAFHDVCWKNLKDAGFPDRIAWMRAAAETRPWMDLSRVGVYGGSAGGQNALGAVLFHGDFYKASAADCGCHDNRMDKIWWNEQWMGWPVGPEYADNSNVTHARELRGNLMLIVGELDHNVDPASTMQVVNALIKADKDFDLLVVPGADHGAGGAPYGRRRQADFFVRHLLGVEPRA